MNGVVRRAARGGIEMMRKARGSRAGRGRRVQATGRGVGGSETKHNHRGGMGTEASAAVRSGKARTGTQKGAGQCLMCRRTSTGAGMNEERVSASIMTSRATLAAVCFSLPRLLCVLALCLCAPACVCLHACTRRPHCIPRLLVSCL